MPFTVSIISGGPVGMLLANRYSPPNICDQLYFAAATWQQMCTIAATATESALRMKIPIVRLTLTA